MPAPHPHLEQLSAGAGRPIVIVDFIRISNGPGLGELFTTGAIDRPVYRIDPVDTLLDAAGYRSPDDLAAAYADTVRLLPAEPALIVGYCTAATLACLLARRLGGQLALVEPTWPAPATVAEDFAGFRAALRPPAQDPPSGPSAVPAGDAASMLAAMADTLHTDLAALAEAEQLEPDEVADLREQLVARYVAWLNVLLGAADRPAGPTPATTVLVSRDFTGARPGQPEPVRLDIPGGELLTSPVTRAALLDLAERTVVGR